MKFIIIGLGNFGFSLAEKLAQLGNEVIGVDREIEKIENIKDKITHAICMDCKNQEVVKNLPLKDTDVVVVCIGEDEGANLLTTALLKKLNVGRLVSRSVSPIHETILEAMGVTEIVRPEEEASERWAKKLTNTGLIDTFELTNLYSINEIKVPKRFVGKTIQEVGFNKNYNVIVLSLMKSVREKNFLGINKSTTQFKVQGIATDEMILHEDEIMVVYGHNNDIKNLLKE
ncbi:MAG: potassium transporter TrkA [Bacteroidetes bacterium HGW-Bacteroidetes-21]|jgi:trk system potassium uptake protein TrkA|nr:MAG: potassium transporter TrkA [Bacteroidetes bacterium HGW-Bacteroidetes-21]